MDNWGHQPLGSHLEAHTPQPNYDLDKEWQWDNGKFGYKDPNVLFTTLHAEYNTLKCAIQDPFAWHSDVSDIARTANTKDEFLTLLKERQKQRIDEIQEAWEGTKELLTAEPSRWDNPPARDVLWGAFLRISRNFSYDSLVAYFGSYLTDDQRSTLSPPSTPTDMHHAKPSQPKRKAKGKMAPSSGAAKPSSKASKSKPKRDSSRQGGVRRSARLQQRAEKARR